MKSQNRDAPMTLQTDIERLLAEERGRIAEELHDRVCQYLFSIVYAVHSMQRDWDELPEPRKREQLKEIRQAATAASRELRAVLMNLYSFQTGCESWLDAVETHLARQAKLNGVNIRFEAPESACRLSAGHQQALYRIIAEGVGNAIRHGASSLVGIRLTLRPGVVKLTIVDNGTGFNVRLQASDRAGRGFGLRNMRMLATSLGGKLRIDSKEGNGTRIRVWLPLNDAGDGAGQTMKSG